MVPLIVGVVISGWYEAGDGLPRSVRIAPIFSPKASALVLPVTIFTSPMVHPYHHDQY